VEDAFSPWAAWIDALPHERAGSPFMFEPALDAADEFHAAPLNRGPRPVPPGDGTPP
jgi:hypothetical protein